VALDLHSHEAVAEYSDGRARRLPLTPHRAVGEVTQGLLASVSDLIGTVEIDPTPQEVTWSAPLDEDTEHATYEPEEVAAYFAAATQAALVLAAFRAPYRGRSTPVNAWWGSFDLAVSLFSGLSVEPPSDDFITRNAGDVQQIEVGWWPGDGATPRRRSSPTRIPPPTASARPPSIRRRRAGTMGWGSTCSTGTTSAPLPIRTASRSNSPTRHSSMPASSAAGTRRSPPAPKGRRRRSCRSPWPRPACLGYPIAHLRCNLARNSFGIGLGAAIRSRSHRPELDAVERLQGNVDRRDAPPPGTLLR
jgi:hypothetical protein